MRAVIYNLQLHQKKQNNLFKKLLDIIKGANIIVISELSESKAQQDYC